MFEVIKTKIYTKIINKHRKWYWQKFYLHMWLITIQTCRLTEHYYIVNIKKSKWIHRGWVVIMKGLNYWQWTRRTILLLNLRLSLLMILTNIYKLLLSHLKRMPVISTITLWDFFNVEVVGKLQYYYYFNSYWWIITI